MLSRSIFRRKGCTDYHVDVRAHRRRRLCPLVGRHSQSHGRGTGVSAIRSSSGWTHPDFATAERTEQSGERRKIWSVAAGNAEKAVNDVAAGVKQGLDSKTPPGGAQRVDLNEASTVDLAGLPGISLVKARQIIDHRPYRTTHDLVKSGILSEHQFEDIAIPAIAKYNGRLLLRVRPGDDAFIQYCIDKPYEIHLVEFNTEQDFENFKQDEERKKFLYLKEASIKASTLIQGTKV